MTLDDLSSSAPPAWNEPAPRREIELLYRIAQDLLTTDRHLGPVLKAILTHMASVAGMERGMITVLDPSRDLARVDVAHGLSSEQQARGRYQLGEGVIGKVLERGQPALVPTIGDEPLFLDRTGARKNLDRSKIAFLCAPITHRGETLGTLSVDRVYGQEFSLEDDMRILQIVAMMIGQAVRQRRDQVEEVDSLKRENRRMAAQQRVRTDTSLIGSSSPMQSVIEMVHQVAPSEATVLIRGESGTGKELIAQAIHANSARKDGPFIAVNCGSIPEPLVESELFGHIRGAFTGAAMNRVGRFEAANGGTLFLDEIGELSMASQVKLLRALQSRVIDRVGESRGRPIDVRVVAATNADLERHIQDGRFRDDLYYRLNVFPIYLPSLRDRKADITQLADHFLERYAKEHNREVKRVSTPAIELMTAYHWPGNVRELENCIARAVLLSTDGVIREHHLPPTLQTGKSSGTTKSGSLHDVMMAYEREILLEAMKNAAGNQSQAARALGTTARILGYRLRRHGLHGGLTLVT
ncbi:MAG: sigma 54-interacting transcriptional regulator [Polyangiales bacterium]